METEADPRSSVFPELGAFCVLHADKNRTDSGSHLDGKPGTSEQETVPAQRQVPEGPRDTDAGAEAMLLRPRSRSRYARGLGSE